MIMSSLKPILVALVLTVAPQGHANIFEWMNAQVLTDPDPEMQPGRRR